MAIKIVNDEYVCAECGVCEFSWDREDRGDTVIFTPLCDSMEES